MNCKQEKDKMNRPLPKFPEEYSARISALALLGAERGTSEFRNFGVMTTVKTTELCEIFQKTIRYP